jgi:hypothetical protein
MFLTNCAPPSLKIYFTPFFTIINTTTDIVALFDTQNNILLKQYCHDNIMPKIYTKQQRAADHDTYTKNNEVTDLF